MYGGDNYVDQGVNPSMVIIQSFLNFCKILHGAGEFQSWRKAHRGRRINRGASVKEDKRKGEKKKEKRKQGIERHVHNLLITKCEIRCVTATW